MNRGGDAEVQAVLAGRGGTEDGASSITNLRTPRSEKVGNIPMFR